MTGVGRVVSHVNDHAERVEQRISSDVGPTGLQQLCPMALRHKQALAQLDDAEVEDSAEVGAAVTAVLEPRGYVEQVVDAAGIFSEVVDGVESQNALRQLVVHLQLNSCV